MPEYSAVPIYHLSVKPISRSAGRSATAAAAYRAGELGVAITDERTGDTHDYTRKRGVLSAEIVLPDGAADGAANWALDRPRLWNAAELAEKRKDACVAREYEVALPVELSGEERRRLAVDFAKELANREGCAVDVCIHAPGKEGDSRNHHAHILRTTRKVEAEGLGAKLDTEKAGRNRTADLEAVRARWAELTNERLKIAGIEERVDHRTLAAQGIERVPTKHLGPAAVGFERRTGARSENRMRQEEVIERLTLAKEAGELARQVQVIDRSIIDLTGDIEAAKRERERQVQARQVQERQPGVRPLDEETKRRVEAMTAAEMRAAIQSIRPPPVDDLVGKDPAVLEAQKRQEALGSQVRQFNVQKIAAQQAAAAWRAENPVRAKLHDAGVLKVEFLANQDEAVRAAIQESVRVKPLFDASAVVAKEVWAQAHERITAETALVRKRIAVLEVVLAGKVAKEADARERLREQTEFRRSFHDLADKRASRAPGYGDAGDYWQAAPEKLRWLIDQINGNPPEVRVRVVEILATDPAKAAPLGTMLREYQENVRKVERDSDRGVSR